MPNITSRDFPTILGENPYETPWKLLEDKVEKRNSFAGNKFVEHGAKYEGTAIDLYEKMTGNEVARKQGNRKHPDYPWVTGRLDGLTQNNCVLEIKCPWKKRVEPLTMENVPRHYWCQCQVYMNMVDAEITHYVEYHVAAGAPTDGSEGELSFVPVIRDRKWWDEGFPRVEKFYNEMAAWCEIGSLVEHPVRQAEMEWQTTFGLPASREATQEIDDY